MRFVYLSAVLAGVILAGTAGYVLIEGWTLDEALYMTVISLTTAGYGEVHALSPARGGGLPSSSSWWASERFSM